jgi:hypothetical protein
LRERLRGTPCSGFFGILLQSADQLRAPFPVLPPQEIPRFTSFVENYTSSIAPCCPFHRPILSSGHTDGGLDGSTVDSMRAASKSVCRKRQTRRCVPESANAFTLPWRTQSNSVRILTLRYRAASAAVSHSAVVNVPTWLGKAVMGLSKNPGLVAVVGRSIDSSGIARTRRRQSKPKLRSK